MPPSQPYRVTVVCLGNICRSPIGEAVLRDRVQRAGLEGLVAIDSAGTGSWHIGHDADPRSLAVLEAHGYVLDHAARQIAPTWLDDIDLLLAMDTANYQDLAKMRALSAASPELRMMRSFDPLLAGTPEPNAVLDVPDPYYGGQEGFVEVLRMIEAASDGLVSELQRRVSG
jgi:protein-tyrosine phosphatase